VPERLFTLAEAAALLPAIRRMLGEAQTLRQAVSERSARLEGIIAAPTGNGHQAASETAARQAFETAAAALQQILDQFAAMGVELKGIDEGLVDFRSERDGRVVYLCWRLGEESIAFWHELDTGFGGRQPL